MMSPLQAANYRMSLGDIKQPYRTLLKSDNLYMAKIEQPVKKPKAPLDPAVRVWYEEFRDRLVASREAAGMNQEELADLLGIPLANYKHMEGTRLTRFPLHKLGKLAKVLHTSVDFLVTGKEARRPHDEIKRVA
jgi:ribosome-binding protein aMBF1 (putative translation factor)